MEREKQNFEKYPELAEHIERMASTGRTGTGSEWCAFLNRLNEALSLHNVVGQSEQLKCDKHHWMYRGKGLMVDLFVKDVEKLNSILIAYNGEYKPSF